SLFIYDEDVVFRGKGSALLNCQYQLYNMARVWKPKSSASLGLYEQLAVNKKSLDSLDAQQEEIINMQYRGLIGTFPSDVLIADFRSDAELKILARLYPENTTSGGDDRNNL